MTRALNVCCSLGEFREIISELGSNNAHGYGITSICMLQLCDESKPLETYLQISPGSRGFLLEQVKEKYLTDIKKTVNQKLSGSPTAPDMFIYL